MKYIMIILVITLSTYSFAEIVIWPKITIDIDNSNDELKRESESDRHIIEGTLLWKFKFNGLLGLTYKQEDHEYKPGKVTPAATYWYIYDYERTSYGPTFGWTPNSNVFLTATYFFKSTYNKTQKYFTESINITTDYEYSGTGYQIGLGYLAKVSKVFITVGIIYSKFTYDEKKTDGTKETITSDLEKSDVAPYIGLMINL